MNIADQRIEIGHENTLSISLTTSVLLKRRYVVLHIEDHVRASIKKCSYILFFNEKKKEVSEQYLLIDKKN